MTGDKPTRPARPSRRPGGDEDKRVLPDRPRDETDVGWGDEPAERDRDWYERQRPPHHE